MKAIAMSPVRLAKDGRQFFVLSMRAGLGQRPINRTFWQQFKRVNGVNTEEKYWERISPEEAKEAIASGEKFEARSVTHQVVPYPLGDRMIEKYTTAVFPDEDEISLFANQRHNIVVPETGEVLGVVRPAVSSPLVIAPEGSVSQEVINDSVEMTEEEKLAAQMTEK